MSTLYNGKLTAWVWTEAEKILKPILPPIGKLYEGKNTFEVKTQDPRFSPAREAIVALGREYAAREKATPPIKVSGEVDHGCEDDT